MYIASFPFLSLYTKSCIEVQTLRLRLNANILQRVSCEVRGSYGTPVSLLRSILCIYVGGDVSFLPIANTRITPGLQDVVQSMDCCRFFPFLSKGKLMVNGPLSITDIPQRGQHHLPPQFVSRFMPNFRTSAFCSLHRACMRSHLYIFEVKS